MRALSFSPDGRFIASGDDSGSIVLWDAQSCEPVNDVQSGSEDWVRALVFTPDGKYLLTAGDDCAIWGWNIPKLDQAFEPCKWHKAPVRALVVSADGHTLFSASEDQFVCIWELPPSPANVSGPVRVDQLSHPTKILCEALSQDGSSLATGATDGTVHLWLQDGNDGADSQWNRTPLLGHSGPVYALAYSLEPKAFISGGEDRTLRIWDAKTGAALRIIQAAHDNVVHAIATCSTGYRIFSASRDASVRFWGASDVDEETALPLRTHPAPVLSLALSPDGKRLISGYSDGRVIIHDVASSLRAWPQGFERSASGSMDTTCSVDKQGIGLGAQLHEDGWLRGRRGETLLWIPPAYRSGFRGPSCSAVLGTSTVSLDLRGFVHGDAWTDCYAGSHQT